MHIISQNTSNIVSKIEIPNIVTVILNSHNIIEVKWEDTLEEISKEHLKKLTDVIRELGNSKKNASVY